MIAVHFGSLLFPGGGGVLPRVTAADDASPGKGCGSPLTPSLSDKAMKGPRFGTRPTPRGGCAPTRRSQPRAGAGRGWRPRGCWPLARGARAVRGRAEGWGRTPALPSPPTPARLLVGKTSERKEVGLGTNPCSPSPPPPPAQLLVGMIEPAVTGRRRGTGRRARGEREDAPAASSRRLVRPKVQSPPKPPLPPKNAHDSRTMAPCRARAAARVCLAGHGRDNDATSGHSPGKPCASTSFAPRRPR